MALTKTKSHLLVLLSAVWLLICILAYSILTYPPLVTLGLLIAIPATFFILLKPFFGVLLIALISPFNDIQRFSSEFSIVKLVGLITILFLLLHIFLKKSALRRTALDLPIIFLVFSCLVPYFNAELGFRNLSSLVSLFSVFIFYFVAVNIISEEKHIKWLLSALFFSGAVVGILSLYCYLSGSQLFVFQDTSPIGLRMDQIRGVPIRLATGSSTSPSEFAALFTLLLPISLGNTLIANKLSRKLLYIALTCIFFLTLLATLSRSAIIGTTVGLVFLLLRYLRYKRTLNLRIAIIIPLFLLLFWLLFKVFPIIPENLIKKAIIPFYYGDKSITDRFRLYPAAVKMAWDHPFGVGYGNFRKEIRRYFGSEHGPHNTILNIMGSNGFFGLFAILWFLYRLFKSLFKVTILENDEKRSLFLDSFIASFIAFWIHASFHAVFQWNILWLFFALAMVSVNLATNAASYHHLTEKEK